ncbi:MAG TPA: tyrosine--tRNA ligase [Aquifex aeolicus]|nr:tyrosine--tRNA ligase [Aquificales bacterium]HIQ25791.1 tyrosine--tRNA ligase [Aquifex aeolicus]
MLDPKGQLEIIKRGAVDLIEEEELLEKLKEGRPLKVKAGFDPTAPDLHLGHVVLLKKLRQFQDLGHEVYVVIGDFTATIGDPTGRNETRPPLSMEQVLENAKTYAQQAFKVLDPKRTKLVYNSQWLENLCARDIVNLTAKYTVARMLEREDFSKRFKEGIPIYIHEFLYPLFQAYDSVALKADVELGGTDQLFNLLIGRAVQREYGQKAQVALTMPLLVGLDGVRKMSKSYGNYVGITEPPETMFGKIMSIPDHLMWDWYKLLTDYTEEEIENFKKLHPRDAKLNLAYTIVARFHGEPPAQRAKENFLKTFSRREFPENAPVFKFPAGTKIRADELILKLGFAPSKKEAGRIIKSGGFKINGEKHTDPFEEIEIGDELKIQVGKKKFAKVIPKG